MSSRIKQSDYTYRLEKIQALLQDQQQDALLLTLGKNFQYLLGSNAHLMERLVLAIVPSEGQPELVSPTFEVGNFAKTTPIPLDRIHPWEETEDPYQLTKEVLGRLGIADGSFVLTPSTPFTLYSKIHSYLPHAAFTDAYPLLKDARLSKTEGELACLQEANTLTAQAIEATFDQLEEGMTEKEVAVLLRRELTDRSGEEVPFAIVQFGVNTADPHGLPTDKKLQPGEVVLIDAGTTVEGYNGDITNTTVFGKPSADFLKVYAIVEEAQERAVDKARDGTPAEQVDQAARAYITEEGYGQYFTHRTGHGVGLDVHEDPYIVGGNVTPLALGQTHSVEPGIYIPGQFGVRIEDIVEVGQDRAIRLANPARRYWER